MTNDDELIHRLRSTLEHEAASITPTQQVPAVTSSSTAVGPGPRPEAAPLYTNGQAPRGWPRWPLAVAAAAVVAAAVTLAALNWPNGGSSRIGIVAPPPRTQPVQATTTPATTPTTVQSQSVAPPTSAPTPTRTAPTTTMPSPVPAGFSPEAVTFVSAAQGWAAGSAPCSSGSCVAVAKTVDGGVAWTLASAPSIPAGPGQAGPNFSIRFADPEDGWIYTHSPAQLWSTHDGGATWHPVTLPTPGAQSSIRAVETSAGRVYAAVIFTSASSTLQMESSPIGTDAWTISNTGIPIGAGPVPSTQLVLQRSFGWLVENDRTVVGGSTLGAAGTWQRWTPPCAKANGAVALAASNPTNMVALCDEGVWGPAANVPAGTAIPSQWLFASSNGGVSFQAVAALHTPSITTLPQVATASSATIVVGETVESASPSTGAGSVSAASSPASAAGTSTAAASGLSASFDGGHTWQTVYAGTAGTTCTYLGFTSLTQGVAIESTATGSELLMTRDGGHTWTPALP